VYHHDDTIAAIASAAGGAARGIVRTSGPRARDILTRCFLPQDEAALRQARQPSLHRGRIIARGARSLELPALVYFWPGARSYTREPVAEIHTIGSPPLLQAVLAGLCAAGARLAEPGEFTLRAFLVGRIDLTQAEAVLGVIDARGPNQYQHALAQLAGGMARPLGQLRDRLLDLLADLEAGLDFVEDDIQFIAPADIERELASGAACIEQLRAQLSARRGRDDLPRAVLTGLPNTGKSSLFNALAAGAEALVSDVPGTTRDYLCAVLDLGNVRCELVDTAGVELSGPADGVAAAAGRSTDLQVECSGVRLLCIDASRPIDPWEQAALAANPPNHQIVVLTKCDVAVGPLPCRGIETSAMNNTGLDVLRDVLADWAARVDSLDSAAGHTAQRCGDSLRSAGESLEWARQLNGRSAGEELVAAEVRHVLEEVGKVVGAVYTDDILDRVFSRFCIGK
jgi:tRNA modification GTPase